MSKLWNMTKRAFSDSETLFLARLQVLFGALMVVDLTPVMPASYLPYYVVGMGIVTEIARRRRANL